MRTHGPIVRALAVLACGCASAPEPADRFVEAPLVDPAIERVAHELVRAAELRSDPAPMRVVVWAETETGVSSAPPTADPPAEEVVDELELVLSPELNLLAADWSDVEDAAANPLRVADALGATHVLVAGLTEHGPAWRVTLRLIETRSHLIVATAHGRLSSEAWTARRSRARSGAVAERAASMEVEGVATVTSGEELGGEGADSSESLDDTPAATPAGDPSPEPTVARVEPEPGPEASGPLPSGPDATGPDSSRASSATPAPAPPGPAALRLRALGRDLGRSTPEE